MNFVKKAFTYLNIDDTTFLISLKYSKKFSPFNANVKIINKKQLTFNLSHYWIDIGEEIKIGLIQELIIKFLKLKKKTIYTELYSDFIQKLDKYTPVTNVDPILKESFTRINKKYFNNDLEMPNLCFGKNSTTQLGCYYFKSNKITISSILKQHPDLLDFVMYHELLHKKERFQKRNGKQIYHTKKFRELEKQFDNFDLINKELKKLVIKNKTKQKPRHPKTKIINKFFDNLFGL